MNSKTKINWLFIVGIVIFVGSLFAAVYFFTRPALSAIWDVSDNGSVGDAINGMTAPIIGTVGAILIFISFREQVKANKLQSEALNRQRELDIVYKFYSELKEDLREIQDVYGIRHKQPSILDSFMNEVKSDHSQYSVYNDLHIFIKYLNDQFMFLASRLIVNRTLGEKENMSLIEKLRRLYVLYFEANYNFILNATLQSQLSKEFANDIRPVTKMMKDLDGYYDHLLKMKVDQSLNIAEKYRR